MIVIIKINVKNSLTDKYNPVLDFTSSHPSKLGQTTASHNNNQLVQYEQPCKCTQNSSLLSDLTC